MNISATPSHAPSITIATPQEMVKKLTKIAIPMIALAGTAMMQQAQAITILPFMRKHDFCFV